MRQLCDIMNCELLKMARQAGYNEGYEVGKDTRVATPEDLEHAMNQYMEGYKNGQAAAMNPDALRAAGWVRLGPYQVTVDVPEPEG